MMRVVWIRRTGCLEGFCEYVVWDRSVRLGRVYGWGLKWNKVGWEGWMYFSRDEHNVYFSVENALTLTSELGKVSRPLFCCVCLRKEDKLIWNRTWSTFAVTTYVYKVVLSVAARSVVWQLTRSTCATAHDAFSRNSSYSSWLRYRRVLRLEISQVCYGPWTHW